VHCGSEMSLLTNIPAWWWWWWWCHGV